MKCTGATDKEDQAAFGLGLPCPCLSSRCDERTRTSRFPQEPGNLLVRGTLHGSMLFQHDPPGCPYTPICGRLNQLRGVGWDCRKSLYHTQSFPSFSLIQRCRRWIDLGWAYIRMHA